MSRTIVALATAQTKAPMAVIRLSGAESKEIAESLSHISLKPRHAHYVSLYDGSLFLDQAVLIWFQAPHSFTGEDVVEFQIHGALPLIQKLLEACLSRGAVLAKAGEFSRRAVENKKMDLLQAEALSALIASESFEETRASEAFLTGEYQTFSQAFLKELLVLRRELESLLDFDLEEGSTGLESFFEPLFQKLNAWDFRFSKGDALRLSAPILLLGRTNAGKSSLFNALSQSQRAITHETEGTTRDINAAWVSLQGVNLEYWDTAGLREASSEIEKLGIDRAKEAILNVALVLWVFDASLQEEKEAISESSHWLPKGKEVWFVANHCDKLKEPFEFKRSFWLSAKKEERIDVLQSALVKHFSPRAQGAVLISKRHQALWEKVKESLKKSREFYVEGSIEIAAFEAQTAHQTFKKILGIFDGDSSASERVLDEVFSHFCVGK